MQSLAGSTERLARTRDYELMDISSSIISTALNIWADDATTYNEDGMVMKIVSTNSRVKDILYELFYDRLNVDYNLWHWVRNMSKYGDFFLLLDVLEDDGIVSFMPLPTVEIDREEGYDGDIHSVRYRWNAASNAIFQNYQICHFRVIGDDTFLPYGKSLLESGRRTWKQLNLIEDAMLVYRIQRAPERRVFKLDVGNMPANEIPAFMHKAKDILKRQPMVDSEGRVDLRFNVHSQEEDYFLAVRGGQSGTTIDTLGGATNLGDIDDVRYVQNNLIAALGIPRAYLTFEEQLNSKTTLSQEDMRFARTIQRIQKMAISELNKLAMIHLFALGIEDPDDLTSFKLYLSNPSNIAEQMKLEMIGSRYTAYETAVRTLGADRTYAMKHILKHTDDQIRDINVGIARDTRYNSQLKVIDQIIQQANMPQGAEGGEESQPGQPPIDVIPGGEGGGSSPAAPKPPKNPLEPGKNDKSAFKNTKNSPMAMTTQNKNDALEEEGEDRELFDPDDKKDLEIIKLQKKYDWIDGGLREQSKISKDVAKIFMNMKENLKQNKDDSPMGNTDETRK